MTPTPLPNEPPKVFSHFQKYCALGPKRSLVKLSRRHGISRGTCEWLSKKYHWQARLKKLLLEDCRRSVEADERAKLRVAEERERQRTRFIELTIKASQKATEKALRLLDKKIEPEQASKLLATGYSIGASVFGLPGVSSNGNPVPTAPVNVAIVFEQDAHSEEVRRNQDEFFRQHPELKRPASILDAVQTNGEPQ